MSDDLSTTQQDDAQAGPAQPAQGRLRVSAGKRAGRGHRARAEPCQDAFAVHVDSDGGRAVAAVADGLGSRPSSQHGSQAACDAAVASLQAEAVWDREAMLRAFTAALQAVRDAAAAQGLTADDLATTLQVAAVTDGRLVAGMLGDGAVVCGDPAAVVLAPPRAGYANEVYPLTAPGWEKQVQVVELEGAAADAATPILLFSDGLTRLLLARDHSGWTPFAPFFEAFLPRLATGDGVVQAFLDGDQVDRSWDDDKCMAVIHRAA